MRRQPILMKSFGPLIDAGGPSEVVSSPFFSCSSSSRFDFSSKAEMSSSGFIPQARRTAASRLARGVAQTVLARAVQATCKARAVTNGWPAWFRGAVVATPGRRQPRRGFFQILGGTIYTSPIIPSPSCFESGIRMTRPSDIPNCGRGNVSKTVADDSPNRAASVDHFAVNQAQ